MTVLDIRYETTPTVKQVTCKGDYDKIQKYLYDKSYGKVLIPAWGDLRIQHKDNMVVFTEEWYCVIEVLVHGKKQIYKYTAYPGYISDKGSVPKRLRSIVDNDDPHFLIPFYIHDMNYSCHYMNRKSSDILLKAMGVCRGAGSMKANAVYWPVRIGGSKAYKQPRMDIKKERKYVTFSHKVV